MRAGGSALLGAGLALFACIAGPRVAAAETLSATLSGLEEIPPVLTEARGDFRAGIDEESQEIAYTLSYADLEGLVLQAELAFGLPGSNGATVVFLCSNYVDRPLAMPLDIRPCAMPPGTVSGTIEASDVLAVPGQGVEAESFDDFVELLRGGAIYVKIRSSLYSGGELRGQINR